MTNTPKAFTYPLAEVLKSRWLPAEMPDRLPVDHHGFAYEIAGSFNLEALDKALTQVHQAHPALRCQISEREGQAVLACPDHASPSLEVSALEPTTSVKEILRDWFHRPFLLGSSQLCRFLVLHSRRGNPVFAACFHHWVVDASSASLFMQDLKRALEEPGSFVGRPPTDFLVVQGELNAHTPETDAFHSFFERVKTQPEPASLNPDSSFSTLPSGPFLQHDTHFPKSYERLLQELADRWEVSPSLLFFSAYTYLLYRYSNQSTFMVGLDQSLRATTLEEVILGPFSDTHHLLISPTGQETFESWTKDLALAIQQSAELGSERQHAVLEKAYPGRNFAADPLVRCRFSFQDLTKESLVIDQQEWQALPGWNRFTPCELALRIHQDRNQTHCFFEYDSVLVSEATVTRFSRHWEQLLLTALENGAQRLASIDMLTYSEHSEQLSWNPDPGELPRNLSVHRLFEKIVELHPASPCLKFRSTTWTYDQVNGKANRLAWCLKGKGVKPGTCVGVLVERGPELVIALLAILKAGGAYVPLDPETPAPRLSFMMEDTAMPLLLTTGAHSDQTGMLPLTAFDFRDVLEDRRFPTDNLDFQGTGSFPAYVMFTSGTTGQPKGAVISHTNILRLVTHTNFLDFKKCRVFAQSSSPAFDAATFEIWGAFLNGGLLVCIEKDRFLDSEQFGTFLKQEGIDAIFLTTGLFNAFAHSQPDMFAGLNTLLVGGEALAPEFVRKVFQSHPPTRFCNAYGPTENTTFSTYQPVDKALAQNVRIPIGTALSHSSAFVVNAQGLRQPVHLPGELWVGGDGVAIGYWNRPRLTAEKFVPDEFAIQPGARAYRTGDKVCYLPNGAIDFLGRLDHQVKLRGFRIELGEIQQAIASAPGVRDVLVMLREDLPGDKRIAAYWIPQQHDAAPDQASLIEHISTTLAPYMIPSDWICMESFPLNINGKVDRKALPRPERQEVDAAQTDAVLPARNPIETKLASLLQHEFGIAVHHVEQSPILQPQIQDSLDKFFQKIQATFFIKLDGNSLKPSTTVASLSETIFQNLCANLDENP